MLLAPTAHLVPLPPTTAVLATWLAAANGEPTLHALAVDPRADGAWSAELVRVPEREGSTRRPTATWGGRSPHSEVLRTSVALHDAIRGADLEGYSLVSSDLDPRAGFVYLDADAARPTGTYREVPVGDLPAVEAAVRALVAALDAHGRTEPLEG